MHVGVDENGLGPVLGPLVVTGVAFAIEGERPRDLGALVGDSKALVSHGDASLGEAWARALLSAIGPVPTTSSEVLARLSLDDDATLRALCPSGTTVSVAESANDHAPSSLCWPRESEPFTADDALVRRCTELVRGWSGEKIGGRFVRRTPMRILSVRSAIVCASRLNSAAKEGRHRFIVDLHEMERLSLQLHDDGRANAVFAGKLAGEPPLLDAVCGKVGGMDFYGDYFGPLSHRMWATEAEGNGTSAYRFPGLGRFTFLQDADASDPLVGLASLVGKWVRELLMARIVRYLRSAALPEHLPPAPPDGDILPNASGYRDPSTKRLIAATELVRAHRGIPDRCFLR